MHNITIIRPLFARYAQNCFYAKTGLFNIDEGEVQWMEETTLSYPTVAKAYVLAIIPLILMLVGEANQVDNTTILQHMLMIQLQLGQIYI